MSNYSNTSVKLTKKGICDRMISSKPHRIARSKAYSKESEIWNVECGIRNEE